MRENKTKYAILGLLAEGDLTGYDIKKLIDIRFHFFWSESYGQLYPELKQLLEQNWIVAKDSGGGSKRRKTQYSITDAGMDALRVWLRAPVEKESVRMEILLKMYFSGLVEPEPMAEQIGDFKKRYEEQLSQLNLFEKELRSIDDPHGNHQDILRVIGCGQKVFTAYLEWCGDTLDYLERRKRQ